MSFDLQEVNSAEDFVQIAEDLIASGYDVSDVLIQLDNWRYFISEAFLELHDKYSDNGC